MPTVHTVMGWTTIALFGNWVLILLPSITATEGTNLSLAEVIAVDGDQTYVARFGSLDYRSTDRIRVPSESLASSIGYWARVSLLREDRSLPGDPPPGNSMQTISVLYPRDTENLVMFPVSVGFVTIALLAFCFGFTKGKSGIQVFAALIALVATGVGWAAWGFGLALVGKMQPAIRTYSQDSRAVWDARVEHGNALWAGLVGMICLTAAALLSITVIFIRPRDTVGEPNAEETEMKTTKKADSGHDADRDSQTTAV